MVLGVSAQNITISSVDETLANDYAGGCEIDLNNDGLLEVIVGGQPRWEAAGMRVVMDAEGNEVEVDRQCWVLTWDGSKYNVDEFFQVIGIPCSVTGSRDRDSATRNRQAAILEPNSCALSGVNVAVPFLFRQIAADGSVLNGNAPVFHVNSSPTAIFRDVVLQGCPVYGKRGAVFDANRPSKQI